MPCGQGDSWDNGGTTSTASEVVREPPLDGPRTRNHIRLRSCDRVTTDATPVPTSVYRYYDEHGILIYVGITSRGMQRNREHNATKEWWHLVTSQEVEHFETRHEAEAKERSLIRKHLPPFNKQHNSEYKLSRLAYLEFLIAHSVRLPLREEIAALPNKRIWLEPFKFPGASNLVLRTRAEDARIARALRITDPVRVYGFGRPTHLDKLEIVGPFGMLWLNKQDKWILKDAHAVIKSDLRNPDVAHIRVLQIRLDHEAMGARA